MTLIDDVKTICDRLAPHGWQDLFLAATNGSLNIEQATSEELESALLSPIASIDRSIPGFGDLLEEANRAIEPGSVAASLLYHAFASPAVHHIPGDEAFIGTLGREIAVYPTLEELDTIENYIFATANRSLQDAREHAARLLGVSADDVELAVAVFASEYRPASETPHQRFADICLSRTGIARVGTASASYDAKSRGFFPFQEGDHPNAIRVLPCRYVTWLAARSGAKENRFGPARANSDDIGRDFWVPVHKLFDGNECLQGETLEIELSGQHQNRKIERLHNRLDEQGFPAGFSDAERQGPPFTQSQGFAEWIGSAQGGSGVLSPIARALAERSTFEDETLTFNTPPMASAGFSDAFSPTLSLDAAGASPAVRPWPEYAHIRFDVKNGNAEYFGNDADAESRATAGNFRAMNISDWTADGWIEADVRGLSDLPTIPAYSLIAAPDFFPGVDQREVLEWWEDVQDPTSRPSHPQWLQDLLQEGYWDFWRARPEPLSDERFAPNLALSGAGFTAGDTTATAIVTPVQEIDLSKASMKTLPTQRHASLPDSAAGVFAPGWDVSLDRTRDSSPEVYLASYGLGSPFPEDAKLCAALSTFWPAAAPDTKRSFFQVSFSSGSICPLTDDENGATAGSIPWDGLRGPRIVAEDRAGTTVRYPSYELADYTLTALEGGFSIAETQKVNLQEYTGRILATLRMYRAFGRRDPSEKNALHILSFQKIESSAPMLLEAQKELNTVLSGPIYRFEVFDDRDVTELRSGGVKEKDFRVDNIFTLLIGRSEFIAARVRRGDGSQQGSSWQVVDA